MLFCVVSAMSFASQSHSGNPCPVCGRTDGTCKLTDTGTQVCRRPGNYQGEEVDGWRFVSECDGGVFFNYRPVGEESQPLTEEKRAELRAKREAEREAERESDVLSTALALELMKPLPILAEPGELSIRTLRDALDIPCKEAARLRPHRVGNTYIFPMVDGSGTDVGLARRHHASGEKKFKYATGLAIPTNLKGQLHPPLSAREILQQRETGERIWPKDWVHPRLHLVEGPTDTLAMLDMGRPAIGRPNNVGGAEMTAEWLANNAPDFGRDLHFPAIVVWGENDFDPRSKNPNRGWPGRDGALRYAQKLADLHGVPVLVALPPADHRGKKVKDVRDWLQAVLTNGKKDDRTPGRAGVLLDQYLYRIEQDHMGRKCWLVQPGEELVIPPLPGAQVKPRVNAKAVLFAAAVAGTYQSSPVPCHGGDGAAEQAPCKVDYEAMFPDAALKALGESIAADKAEAEERQRKFREKLEAIDWDAEEREASYQYHHGRHVSQGEFPCTNPRVTGLEHVDNWDQADLKGRCTKCHNCGCNRVEIELALFRAQLGKAMRDGYLIYERCIPERQWASFRTEFSNAEHPMKRYKWFRIPGTDRIHIFHTVPSLGDPPVSPGSTDPMEVINIILAEVRPYLEAAVETSRVARLAGEKWGTNLCNASEGWRKSETKRKKLDRKWKVTGSRDDICPEESHAIAESMGLTVRTVQGEDAAQIGENVISFTRYSMPGGWTAEAVDRYLWKRQFGAASEPTDYEVTLSKREPEPVYCGPPERDTYFDEGPEFHPFE